MRQPRASRVIHVEDSARASSRAKYICRANRIDPSLSLSLSLSLSSDCYRRACPAFAIAFAGDPVPRRGIPSSFSSSFPFFCFFSLLLSTCHVVDGEFAALNAEIYLPRKSLSLSCGTHLPLSGSTYAPARRFIRSRK